MSLKKILAAEGLTKQAAYAPRPFKGRNSSLVEWEVLPLAMEIDTPRGIPEMQEWLVSLWGEDFPGQLKATRLTLGIGSTTIEIALTWMGYGFDDDRFITAAKVSYDEAPAVLEALAKQLQRGVLPKEFKFGGGL